MVYVLRAIKRIASVSLFAHDLLIPYLLWILYATLLQCGKRRAQLNRRTGDVAENRYLCPCVPCRKSVCLGEYSSIILWTEFFSCGGITC